MLSLYRVWSDDCSFGIPYYGINDNLIASYFDRNSNLSFPERSSFHPLANASWSGSIELDIFISASTSSSPGVLGRFFPSFSPGIDEYDWFSVNTSISSRLAIPEVVSNPANARALPTATVSSFSKDFSRPTVPNECHVNICDIQDGVNAVTFAEKITVWSLISKSVSMENLCSCFLCACSIRVATLT